MDKHSRVIRSSAQIAFLMAVLTLISKLLGFIREMVMANYYGVTYITDAYVMSFTILSVIFGGLITAVSTAYIPIYSEIVEGKNKEAGDRFTSELINALLILTLVISLIGIVFSNQVISIFASGFSGETARLANFFVRVLFSYVVFSSSAGILESYLHYKGVFLPQIISGYLINACTIAAIIISSYTNYYFLAFGCLLGYILRFLTMWSIAKRRSYNYNFSLKLNDTVKKVVALALPTFIGSYMLHINLFIDRTLASRLAEGSISALNYASLLNGMIMGLTITILSTIIYPKLSQANSLEQYDRFNSIIGVGTTITVMIALPCSLGAMIYSNQVVQIVFERGVFDANASAMTSSAFVFYSAGLLFISLNDLLTRTYYSMHNMKTPMIIGGISVIINVVLNLILVQFMAHNGLALATSVASFCNTILLYIGLKRKHPQIRVLQSRLQLIKITIASITALSISYMAYTFMTDAMGHIPSIIQLSISILVAVIIYSGLLLIFKIEEIKLLKQIIKKV